MERSAGCSRGWGSAWGLILAGAWIGVVAPPVAAEELPAAPAPVDPVPSAPAPVASASVVPRRAPQDFSDYRLGNGLRVILSPRAGASGVTVAVGYATGRGHDPKGHHGLAHLVEHLTYRGSRHLKPFESTAIMDRSGIEHQGYTITENTVYVSSGASNRLATVLWLEAERMAFGIEGVNEQALALEKDIVTNELSERLTNPSYLLLVQRLRKLYGEDHALAAFPEDSNADVQAVSLGDVQWFMQGAYRSDNATLAITGNFATADAKTLVERYFGPIKNHPVPKIGAPVAGPKLCGVHRIDVEHRFMLGQRMVFDWPIDGKWTLDADVALEAVGEILEERVRNALVEGNKASSVTAKLSWLTTHSILSLDVVLPEPADWNGVESRVLGALTGLVTQGPSADETRTMRARLLSELTLTAGDSSSSAVDLAEGRVGSPLAVRSALQRLNPPALAAAARRLSGHLVSRFMPNSDAAKETEVTSEEDPCH